MGLPVVYRQVAGREILAAARDYERQRRGLGAVFLTEVARIEAHISESSRFYQYAVDDVRRAVLRQFPYGLFYLSIYAAIQIRLPKSSPSDDCLIGDG